MSRSRKKTPVCGWSTAESDKAFKVREHKRERRAVNAILPDDELPDPKAFGNPYNGEKDGKQWLGDRHPKLLRK